MKTFLDSLFRVTDVLVELYVKGVIGLDEFLFGTHKQCINCKQVFPRHDDSVGWHGNICGECYIKIHQDRADINVVWNQKQELDSPLTEEYDA